MNDPVTAPSVAAAVRRCASGPPAIRRRRPSCWPQPRSPPFSTNEPAEVGAELATRALAPESGATPGSDGRPWFSFATWFSQATFALLWAERYAQVRPLLDASIAQARATGDSSRLAIGLANRGWLALRRGDLSAAEGDARTALAATELPAPPMYRVLNGGCARRDARRAGRARRGRAGARAARFRSRERFAHRRRSSLRPRPAAGRSRAESPKGSRTSWPSALS